METPRASLRAAGLACTIALALAAAGACSGNSTFPIAGTASLSAPTLSSPAAGATSVSTTTSFSWSGVSGANEYWLMVATSAAALPTDPGTSSCPGCVMSTTIATTSFTPSTALSPGTTYYWQVQAFNDATTPSTKGTYSAQRSFTTAGGLLPAGFDQFVSTVQVTLEGTTVVVRSNGVPNHRSPYFDPSDPRYEPYNGSNPNFMLNPNRIATQSLVFRIPASPTPAATPQATPLGPIGVALNGVPIFNQYAGPNQPLMNEINSFDQYNGHPQRTGMYHYHVEPLFVTAARGKSGLLGFLLDGYPVYGPLENGVTLVSTDLDAYHGHAHATVEYPQGTYHYHVTADAPYINGSAFYGVPGTVGN